MTGKYMESTANMTKQHTTIPFGAADISPALTPVEGAPTVRVVECTECEEQSPLGPPLAEFAAWALGHAAATGHHSFQQVTTKLLHTGATSPAEPGIS
ncbi:DUF7848 domain-containing protein [Streptomyces clavuligerus]|uniref:DUF7848 domain-containing protein n=1 Tax=Streptomyces clavuligerus TaxID=1901 RepID=UPI003556FB29